MAAIRDGRTDPEHYWEPVDLSSPLADTHPSLAAAVEDIGSGRVDHAHVTLPDARAHVTIEHQDVTRPDPHQAGVSHVDRELVATVHAEGYLGPDDDPFQRTVRVILSEHTDPLQAITGAVDQVRAQRVLSALRRAVVLEDAIRQWSTYALRELGEGYLPMLRHWARTLHVTPEQIEAISPGRVASDVHTWSKRPEALGTDTILYSE